MLLRPVSPSDVEGRQLWEAPTAGKSLRQFRAAVQGLPPLGSCDSADSLITDASVVGKDASSLWQAPTGE